jgi:uncharacterized protein YxeA
MRSLSKSNNQVYINTQQTTDKQDPTNQELSSLRMDYLQKSFSDRGNHKKSPQCRCDPYLTFLVNNDKNHDQDCYGKAGSKMDRFCLP